MSKTPAYDLNKLKSTGMMKQKQGDLFSVRLKVVGGHITAEQLRALADAAERHGVGHVHLTTRQGVEVPCVAYEQIEALRETLAGADVEFGACGPRVRTITACQGSLCRYGLIDCQQLARSVDAHVEGIEGLPHKFKLAITGCPNGCIKPQENDLGIMGQSYVERDAELCLDCGLCADACRPGALTIEHGGLVEDRSLCNNCGMCVGVCPVDAISATGCGYAVFVGGKMGSEPRLADRLPFEVGDESILLNVITATLRWYTENGTEKERFGTTIDRVGLDNLIESLTDEVQGLSDV